ncbi:MAG: response regulator transcription factor [Carboxylicivirga sp.]|jgi:DNA-binding response OmpR family regulator|nr:response regulator transcription factor [Carboxylicivirga sp.]MCT4646665.1 response regulator transcription factor [Carboxylicivirga sp.]
MESKRKALIVEDNRDISDLVALHLRDLGMDVRQHLEGYPALDDLFKNSYDLIILDLMLPDIEGMEICRRIRMEKIKTPVIILTSKNDEIDKVLGLETGADDYITKPFSVREFTARVKAIMRRIEDRGKNDIESGSLIDMGQLRIEPESRKVTLDGQRIELTPKEFDLLYLLASKAGFIFSREKLLNLIWGYQFDGYEHTVNSHINRLRSKLEKDPAEPEYILTSWGVGYYFNDNLKSQN